MAISFADVLDPFFGDSGFTVTATIGGVDYTVVRMQRDDSRSVLAAGESSNVAYDILVKVADVAVTVGTAITIGSVVYRAKTVRLDGANLTQRVSLTEQYG